MNKIELVTKVAESVNEVAEINGKKLTKKDTALIVDTIFETMSDELVKGNAVKIANFGKFRTDEVPARAGRNPQTKESLTIAAHKVPRFKYSSVLKSAVRG